MKIRLLNAGLLQYRYTSLVLLLMVLLLSSCATDDSFSNSSSDSTMVKISFFINDGSATRAISTTNESTVSDITVLVFDHSGSLIGSKYVSSVAATSVDVPVTARSATGCTIYAIANTGSSSYFAGVNTISQLNDMSTTIASASTLESAGSTTGSTGALMVGKSSVDISTGGANKFSITLYHQCSKFTFTITPTSGVTVTGYQLCNVPLSSYITDSHVPVSAGPPAGVGSYGNFDAVSGLTNTSTFSKTYYIYENLCGSNSNVTSEALRNSSNVPVSSTSSASYLLVNAKGSGWASTYRIYLGGVTNTVTPVTDLTNFNIYRNLNYQCNISLGTKGGSGDARVTYTSTRGVTGSATVGSYLYSDGTTGTTTSGKTVVGIVFSNQLSSAEYNAGYTHGYALALKDVSTSTYAYETKANESNLTKVATYASYYNDITSGYYGTFTLGYNKGNDNYPAWQAANTYNVNVSGFINSGWYLPSMGQWWDVCANLGKVDLSSLQTSSTGYGNIYTGSTATTNVNNAILAAGGTPLTNQDYWSASECASNGGLCMYFKSNYVTVDVYLKSNSYYVRSVLAF